MDLDDPAVRPQDVAQRAAAHLAERTGVERYDAAVVLGSGWAAAADALGETVAAVPAHEIPGFVPPVVAGHTGTLRSVCTATGRWVLVVGARTHLYQGLGIRRVVHPVRTAAAAGARVLVLTNGCGGLDPSWTPGTPVLISDHLNLTGVSALEGATFVDLTDLYSTRLRAVAREVDPTLPEGVYAQLPGPHYETPAEVRMLGTLGAHMVGMSTALEAIAARAAGLEVLGLSLVTNFAAGVTCGERSEVTGRPLSHAEVVAAGQAAAPRLLAGVVARL